MNLRRRSVWVTGCAIASVTAALNGRAMPSAQSFRVSTTLNQSSVVALDARGQPVTDLRKDEVTVTENGRPREVVFLTCETSGEPASRPEPLPSGFFTNRPEFASGPQHLTAIVISVRDRFTGRVGMLAPSEETII